MKIGIIEIKDKFITHKSYKFTNLQSSQQNVKNKF